ncbi:hypothetical protein EIN_186060 [Entamoeba invadens IP1]|uniref:hypothetical protein n=1 Tax=Entamoeba invadens IP1 TaxID=370355 RepID=UPI0002C3DDC4|nr:hypothetical protein EIN_186060 [Entamoeba invadens IP1]ELP94189.1 hypothetical protein EIN_186060 [Entamoeba invadens IP1]|eukprot:XP_004260960.1 hypothetical protein EIN_186060 [Entamoeba invadens IP1]
MTQKVRLQSVFLMNALFYLPDVETVERFEMISKACQIAILSTHINPYNLASNTSSKKIQTIFPKIQTLFISGLFAQLKSSENKKIDNIEIARWDENVGMAIFKKQWFLEKIKKLRITPVIATSLKINISKCTNLVEIILTEDVPLIMMLAFLALPSLRKVTAYIPSENEMMSFISTISESNKKCEKNNEKSVVLFLVVSQICDDSIVASILAQKPSNVTIYFKGTDKYSSTESNIFQTTDNKVFKTEVAPRGSSFYNGLPFDQVKNLVKYAASAKLQYLDVEISLRETKRGIDFTSLELLKTLVIDKAKTSLLIPKFLENLSIYNSECEILFGTVKLTKLITNHCACKGTLDVGKLNYMKVLNDKSHFNFTRNGKAYQRELPIELDFKCLKIPERWFTSKKVLLLQNGEKVSYPNSVLIDIENGEYTFKKLVKDDVVVDMSKFNFFTFTLKETVGIKKLYLGNIYQTLIIGDKNSSCILQCKHIHFINSYGPLKTLLYSSSDFVVEGDDKKLIANEVLCY